MIKYLVIINFIGLLICFIDKKNAIKNRYRIPEIFLLFISIIGGVGGFIIGMILFHHKTKKVSFIILEPIFLALWLILIYYK